MKKILIATAIILVGCGTAQKKSYQTIWVAPENMPMVCYGIVNSCGPCEPWKGKAYEPCQNPQSKAVYMPTNMSYAQCRIMGYSKTECQYTDKD